MSFHLLNLKAIESMNYTSVVTCARQYRSNVIPQEDKTAGFDSLLLELTPALLQEYIKDTGEQLNSTEYKNYETFLKDFQNFRQSELSTMDPEDQAEYQAAFSTLHEEYALRKERAQIRHTMDTTRKEINTADVELKKVRHAITANDQQLIAAGHKMTAINNKISAVDHKLAQAHEELSEVDQELANSQAQQAYYKALAQIDSEYTTALKNRLAWLEANVPECPEKDQSRRDILLKISESRAAPAVVSAYAVPGSRRRIEPVFAIEEPQVQSPKHKNCCVIS